MTAPVRLQPDDERLAALAEFAAGAGHEINNPLATILGRAQQLLRDEQDPQRRYALSVIAGQALRIRDMIGDTMAFARPAAPVIAEVPAQQVIDRALAGLAATLEIARCRVTVQVDASLVVLGDAAQLTIVITELLRNSAQALAPDGGPIELVVRRDTADRGVLEVIDRGRGFTEEQQRHAFDPFYSGRQAGRGLGFGLCKVWQIVRLHNGSIEIETTPAGLTVARVVLPLADDASPAAE